MFEFNEDFLNEIKLDIISEEMLDLALHAYINCPELQKKAIPIIGKYIIRDMVKQNNIKNKNDLITKFVDKAMELTKNYALEKLAGENLLDVEFSEKGPKYSLTQHGKELQKVISITGYITKYKDMPYKDIVLMEIKN